MRFSLTVAAIVTAAVLGPAAYAVDVTVSMAEQINVGKPGTVQSPSGDAIYPLSAATGQVSFGNDGDGGYTRLRFPGNANPDPAKRQGWFYLYLDTNLAGFDGGVDLSGDSSVSFDARYFQDPQTNTKPYSDAPIFVRLYTYGGPTADTLLGYSDFSIVYATQAPWNNPPYPTWTRVTLNPMSGTVTNAFDLKHVTRMRWYGTDWNGAGDDFIDIRNVTFSGDYVKPPTPPIPEPASMALLLTGALPLLARRRKA